MTACKESHSIHTDEQEFLFMVINNGAPASAARAVGMPATAWRDWRNV
jgi:hypothetical protein